MNKAQIDNSHFDLKILLRLKAIKESGLKEIKVLDAYSGDGRIWFEIAKHHGYKITLVRLDIKKDRRGIYLCGDNRKILSSLNLREFDFIDLDAYGVPYYQLKEVFRQQSQAVIFVTYILKGLRTIARKLLNEIGYSTTMIEKIPTLFNSRPLDKMGQFLAQNGIDKIVGYFLENNFKNYFYFMSKNDILKADKA
jgi:hypothetical protein